VIGCSEPVFWINLRTRRDDVCGDQVVAREPEMTGQEAFLLQALFLSVTRQQARQCPSLGGHLPVSRQYEREDGPH
jgi:hypothetical protein